MSVTAVWSSPVQSTSTIIEMRSAEYLALPHGRGDSEASGSSAGLVET